MYSSGQQFAAPKTKPSTLLLSFTAVMTCIQVFAAPMTRSSALLPTLVAAAWLRVGTRPIVNKHARRSLDNSVESASCESTVSSCSCCCSSCPATFCLRPGVSEETVSGDVAAALFAAAAFWYVSLACCALLANHSSPDKEQSSYLLNVLRCTALLLYC